MQKVFLLVITALICVAWSDQGLSRELEGQAEGQCQEDGSGQSCKQEALRDGDAFIQASVLATKISVKENSAIADKTQGDAKDNQELNAKRDGTSHEQEDNHDVHGQDDHDQVELQATAKHTQGHYLHRNGEVNLSVTTAHYDDEDKSCKITGSLFDKDENAGILDISFEIGWLSFNITDTSTKEVLWSQNIIKLGIPTKWIAIEDDMFTDSDGPGDNFQEAEEEEEASLSQAIPSKVMTYVGKVSMHDPVELQSLRRHAIQHHHSNATSSEERWNTDLAKLFDDKRDNAIIELSMALAKQSITGATYPCSYDLHKAAALLLAKSTSLTESTLSDVKHFTTGDLALLESGSDRSCKGCSTTCGNECFGRCGDGCNNWWWVCGDGNAYQGCCEHDGYCSCDSTYNKWCVGFFGNCWTPGCAASRCTRCDSCTGNGKSAGICATARRRRRSGWR